MAQLALGLLTPPSRTVSRQYEVKRCCCACGRNSERFLTSPRASATPAFPFGSPGAISNARISRQHKNARASARASLLTLSSDCELPSAVDVVMTGRIDSKQLAETASEQN